MDVFVEKCLQLIWVFVKKEMSFECCFLETNILWLLYPLCIAQSEEDLRRFQVEAHRAYTCRQILGLCHAVADAVSAPAGTDAAV